MTGQPACCPARRKARSGFGHLRLALALAMAPAFVLALAFTAGSAGPAAAVDTAPAPPAAGPFAGPPPVASRPLPGGVGISLGYPSAIGAFVCAPIDATLGYRFGLTGFPGAGLLWSPGVELRFHQVRGLYSANGFYLFGDALFARDYGGRDDEDLGMELGAGWRWFSSDLRGFRWIGAVEAGGWWTPASMSPHRPALRLYWIAARR
jgi:hypothetical protein